MTSFSVILRHFCGKFVSQITCPELLNNTLITITSTLAFAESANSIQVAALNIARGGCAELTAITCTKQIY